MGAKVGESVYRVENENIFIYIVFIILTFWVTVQAITSEFSITGVVAVLTFTGGWIVVLFEFWRADDGERRAWLLLVAVGGVISLSLSTLFSLWISSPQTSLAFIAATSPFMAAGFAGVPMAAIYGVASLRELASEEKSPEEIEEEVLEKDDS